MGMLLSDMEICEAIDMMLCGDRHDYVQKPIPVACEYCKRSRLALDELEIPLGVYESWDGYDYFLCLPCAMETGFA